MLVAESAQVARRSEVDQEVPVIALAGNPNAGKTSLFNALTGQNQHVGNYPGVTVDKVVGRVKFQGRELHVVDLPGTYSLSAYSLEEVVARDFVLQDRPALIVDVLDSTNLERNLYLLLQLQELGVPTIGVLNLADEADKQGIQIDVPLLSTLLGIPLVRTVAARGTGKEELLRVVVDVLEGRQRTGERHLNYGPELEAQHESLIGVLGTDPRFALRYSLHWMAIKLIEEDRDAIAKVKAEHSEPAAVLQAAKESRAWIAGHFGQDPEVVVGQQRYAYIRGACREAVRVAPRPPGRLDVTERVDRVVLNRYLGLPLFLLVMLGLYAITFKLGTPASDLVQSGFRWLGAGVGALLGPGLLRDFLVEGVLAGVGGVLGFFPLVMLLFLSLSFLEDVGYLARAAFVMDKFLHLFGLHGRSFLPLMVSTGCAVPGVLSARTLSHPRDRIVTILISPLMLCGAKTPVVAMLCAAFFPKHAFGVFWSFWVLSWLVALGLGLVFRKTLFRGEDSPFVMELPPYRLPTVRGVGSHLWQRSLSYVRKAGTLILAASILLWASLHFPTLQSDPSGSAQKVVSVQRKAEERLSSPALTQKERSQVLEERNQQVRVLEYQRRKEETRASVAGRVGEALQPVLGLAGFDWRINVALISGLAAKEVILSTLSIAYGLGEVGEEEGGQSPLAMSLRSDSALGTAGALSLLVFVMLYTPCLATLAVVRKELGSWKWSAFLAGYTLVFAYALAVLVYQVGRMFA